MKYIMFEDAEGRKMPVIFPELLVHADVAKVIQRAMPNPVKIKSAGFVILGADVHTHGESETLGVKGRDIDAAYIVSGDAGAYMPEMMVEGILKTIRSRNAKGR